MPIVDPLGSVERAIVSRLSDGTIGLIASYIEVCGGTDAYNSLDALDLDFDPEGPHFALGMVEWPQLTATTDYSFPYLMLDVVAGAEDQGPTRVKGIPFSGTVNANMRMLVSWTQEQVTDFSTMPNAIIAAMITCFNSGPQKWAPEIVYNGQISAQKTQPMLAGDNWLRAINFQTSFYCVIKG